MSSYRQHGLLSILMAIPFFQAVFPLALALIGAMVPDMDHEVKSGNVSTAFLIGLVIFMVFYILGLPYIAGIALMDLALIFYLSRHRGFTHSILGAFILSACLTVFVLSIFFLLRSFGVDERGSVAVILISLGFIILNRVLILPFILLTVIGVFLTPFPVMNLYTIMGPFLLGFLSHAVLDSFTPSGVRFMRPFSGRTFKKGFGVSVLLLWGAAAVYYIIF
ncbi:metal-dependent hydrolase [Methanothermobacter wolfeii]|uniref:metal-dependent hydrolase n=1 Tax=Methanothermobacter wolfeii TaxID=145261 RepID=UPI0024B35EA8|nr:metal-dependent hydrolase [Methanothermobacter wolfeii]MDI6702540.1 metal-dependent hydrolase [Methanothermobacter wolfeii]